MGSIARFDLPGLARPHRAIRFVETGTGRGDSLAHAARTSLFVALWSCEIEIELARSAGARFANDPRVRILTGSSTGFLDFVGHSVPADDPILYFLDAHFPGADYGLRSYGAEQCPTLRLPLAEELGMIERTRRGEDVIVIDDLRIYVDGPFGSGNLPAKLRPFCPRERSIDFVRDIMGSTHEVTLKYEDEGYILLTPKFGRGEHADD